MKEILERKYKNLYGENAYKETMAKDLREQTILVIVLIFVFLLLIIYSTVQAVEDNPYVVKEDGQILEIARPEKEEGATVVPARIYAIGEDEVVELDRNIVIDPYSSNSKKEDIIPAETYEDRVSRKINQSLGAANSDTMSESVVLPKELEDGTRLLWKERRDNRLFYVLMLFAMVLYFLYRNRFSRIEKLEQEAMDSIVRELPEFLNKLVVYLKAGIVLNKAFLKASEGMIEDTYFSNQMDLLRKKVEVSKSPFEEEFRSFAKRCQVKELMRIATIIYDNVDKGTELTEKLKNEGELLWFERKKAAEEKGRLAETKLTLPLIILLLVLVVVTIAPAMIEM